MVDREAAGPQSGGLYSRRKLNPTDYRLMAMPKKFQGSQLGGVHPSVRDKVKRLLWRSPEMFQKGANIIVSGHPGSGKSSVASLFARGFRAYNIPSFWTDVWRLREQIRERERYGQDGDLSMMQRVRTVEVLVIDDLKNTKMDGWFSLDDLTNLVRTRHENMLPTIITTSMEGADFSNHPVVDQIFERMILIEIRGDDLRERKSKHFGREFD